jgi:hypothetical protein
MSTKFAKTARLARQQRGRVAWRQLVAAGVDPDTIKRWLKDGRLHHVHQGVYAVGHLAPSIACDYMAAVLACGPGAVLSHRAAAHDLRLTRGSPPPPEVTVPTLAGRRRPGIVIHRVKVLHPLDTSMFEGISIATVPRVLLDLAPRTPPQELTRMCHEAWIHHDTGPREVEACVARNPHKKAIAKLRRAMLADVTLSQLEGRFLALLEKHHLPRPRTNIGLNGDKVDCHWPAHDLTVELLSFRFHGSRAAFEADVARRRRSGHLAFTYGDVYERPAETIAELRAALRG